MSKIEIAVTGIEALISEGPLLPNNRLPPERDLCALLGVSRNTLRSALDKLESDGKIWRRMGSGTFAGAPPVASPVTLFQLSEASNPFELMELRRIVEPQIARLAALRATPSEIETIKQCVRRSLSAPDSESYEFWDALFHNSIADATHNTLIRSTFASINELRRMTLWGQLRDKIVADGAQRHWAAQHEAIVNAIADRDAEGAERHARKHVDDLLNSMSSD